MQSSREILLLESLNDNDQSAFQALQHLKKALQDPNNSYLVSSAQGGVSAGTCFIEGVNEEQAWSKKKKLAVFKDQGGDPLSPDNPSSLAALSRFGDSLVNFAGYRSANKNTVTGQGFASDLVCSLLFNRLNELVNFNKIKVPNTVLVENIYLDGVEKKKGILIEFIENTRSLEEFNLSELPGSISLEAFEQLALIDYLYGNNDGKPGNILLQADKDMLYHIDNSWAFSPLQGERWSVHQYAFGGFPVLRDEKFSDESREKLVKIFDHRHELALMVFNQFNELKAPYQTEELNLQRAMCFLHRIEMLHHLICVKDATFSELSKMRYEVEFLDKHLSGDVKLSPSILNPETSKSLYETTLMHLEKSVTALHYTVFYTKDESLSKKQLGLHNEIIRLTRKAIRDDYWAKGMGAHVSDIENKADNCCKQYYEHLILLKLKGFSSRDIDEHIDNELRNPDSKLYQALTEPVGVGGRAYSDGVQYINSFNLFSPISTNPIWQTCAINEILAIEPVPRIGLNGSF